VGALRDLAVGPADTDRDAPHQQCTVLHVRARDGLEASGPLLAWHNRHRALSASSHPAVAAPHPEGVMTSVVGLRMIK
jgi:hypothetical protein